MTDRPTGRETGQVWRCWRCGSHSIMGRAWVGVNDSDHGPAPVLEWGSMGDDSDFYCTGCDSHGVPCDVREYEGGALWCASHDCGFEADTLAVTPGCRWQTNQEEASDES